MSRTIKGKPRGWFNRILVFDTETTGLCTNADNPAYNPETGEKHQIVSIGMIVADAQTFETIDELYVEIKWNDDSLDQREKDPSFGKRAEEIHGLTLEYLEDNGVDEEQAVIMIGEFILKHFADENIRTAAHNGATFDVPFLKTLFRKYQIELKFGNRHCDTWSIGFATFETYNSDDLFAECGFDARGDHNALEDARMALESLKIVRTIFKKGLDWLEGV